MLSRKAALRTALLVAVGLILPLAGFWFVATQPLFSTPPRTIPVTADPTRVEGHVRMLSDWAHPNNLDRAARRISKGRPRGLEEPFLNSPIQWRGTPIAT